MQAWVRTAAKAVIIRDGKLLMNHCRDAQGDWYGLPGGGQRAGEPLAAALVRECLEEIGANHEFSYLDEATHQVEHLFECRVAERYEPANGPAPDRDQVGVVWLGYGELRRARVYPSRLYELVDPAGPRSIPVYWGDVN
jgi:ADP-ribose pyrophosphatase YjhB (NUDIX family)